MARGRPAQPRIGRTENLNPQRERYDIDGYHYESPIIPIRLKTLPRSSLGVPALQATCDATVR